VWLLPDDKAQVQGKEWGTIAEITLRKKENPAQELAPQI